MEYTIVEGFEAAQVVENVKKHFEEGWELYGDLAIAGANGEEEGRGRHVYAQAMIRRRKEGWETA